jgi:precorrin-6A/cobalt-precorrin-6A reductase
MRVLILGGTTEGYELAEALARDKRFVATYSLAGRTKTPLLPGGSTRVGGFGGAQGLAAWLRADGVAAVVDATHPYAARISANATEATDALGVPLLRLDRPEWRAKPGDDWRVVPSAGAAVEALGATPRRVFLAIGRTDLAVFRAAPQHGYVIRSVDAPDADSMPPDSTVILERGPFAIDAEVALMQARAIDTIVCKNSGGEAAYGKIAAARQLGIPVVMIRRPPLPAAAVCTDVASAVAWLEKCIRSAHGRELSARGV